MIYFFLSKLIMRSLVLSLKVARNVSTSSSINQRKETENQIKSKDLNMSIMFIKMSSTLCNFILTVVLMLKLASAAHADIYKNARLGTRIVQTRYGRLQGLVLPLDNFKFLKPVEAFLSVPYATPPTRSNR